jgi:putative ABC transport system permease protein
MFRNYFKIMLRNLWKYKSFAFINIFGFSIGIACFLLISLWVTNELSYDKFHKNIDRLYRINTELSDGRIIPNSSLRLGKELQLRYPEIKEYTNFIPWARSLVKYKNKSYDENNIYLVDPAFFSMFSFHFVSGNPSNPLPDSYSIIMTDETARKYFGNENPIGKRVHSDLFDRDFTVTAVVKKMPTNSTLQFNIAGSINLMPLQRRESWEFSGWTYILLKENVSEKEFDTKIKNFYKKYVNTQWDATLKLQNYASIHLFENGKAGLVKLVYIFSIVAVLVLLIACFNFMNLSTARSTRRALEVGIRKVNGAGRKNLIFQFLGESVFITFLAAFIALIIVELALPSFNNFTGKSLSFNYENINKFVLGPFAIALFTGLIAGIFPAFILSSFKPASVLKGGKLSSFAKGAFLRKVLTTSQFILSIGLIICALIVKEQMDFVRNTNLGMDRESVITLPNNVEISKKYDTYKSLMLRNKGIESVSASATQPFDVNQNIEINWQGHMDEEPVNMRYTMIDYDFFKTMGMEIVDGRDFSKKFPADSTHAVILNESAVKLMGFKNPIGKTVYFGHPAFPENKRFVKIIGVVKDFHFRSLHSPMGPFIFRMYQPWLFNIFIKLKPGNVQETIAGIQEISKKIAPDYPFKFQFLDDIYNRMYLMENKVSVLFNVFSGLAIIISCLGLFGLAAYTVEQRTKEIGIRKVLGAKVPAIVFLLSKEFTKWIIIANVIAWPVAYYFMSNWLNSFAYRIDVSIWYFLFAGGIAVVVALVTIGIHAIKAATANPIESLRYE